MDAEARYTVYAVPKRTNIFQQVVAIIYEHMAGDAAVEESGMLPHRVTGKKREVDVVIRSTVAGHEVIVSVEATATGRKADTEWVERIVQKHRNLPTSQLVLVSQAGFTDDARKEAEAENAVPLSPEDLGKGDPAFVVVNALVSLWPKRLDLTPEDASVIVRRPDGNRVRVKELKPDHQLFLADGQAVGMLGDVFKGFSEDNMEEILKQSGLVDIAEGGDRFFVLGGGPPFLVRVDEQQMALYLRWEESDPPELHEIESLEFRGKARIHVTEMPLQHKRLGEITYAYGEAKLGDHPLLMVVSENSGGGKATVRFRPVTAGNATGAGD